MKPTLDNFTPLQFSRRAFLTKLGTGVGVAALSSLLGGCNTSHPQEGLSSLTVNIPHFAPRVKRIIYLFQSGGPAQMELFDYKPLLQKKNGEELPNSVRNGQRLTLSLIHI